MPTPTPFVAPAGSSATAPHPPPPGEAAPISPLGSSPRSAAAWPVRPIWTAPAVAGLAVATDQLRRADAAGLGISLVLGASALMVAMLQPARHRARSLPLGLATLSAVLPALRQSPVVVALAILSAVALLFFAAADAVDPRVRFAPTVGRAFRGLVEGPRWILRPLRSSASARQIVVVARSLTIAGIVAAAVGLALMAADPVFAEIVGGVSAGPSLGRLIWWLVIASPFAALAWSAATPPATAIRQPEIGQALGAEGVAGVASLAAVLGAWCTTQLVVALGGAQHVLDSAGLSKAEYARSGFFQLVWTTALILGLLLLLDRLTSPTKHDRWFVAGSTVVMIESLTLVAATGLRLSLYTDAFGLTLSRVVAGWLLGWLALLVIRTWLGVVRRRTGLGPWSDPTLGGRFVVYSAAIMIVAFGCWNPEARIVDVNIERARHGSALDLEYLTTLSADGLVALANTTSSNSGEPPRVQQGSAQLAIDAAICRGPGPNPRWNTNWSLRDLQAQKVDLGCS